MIMPTIFVIIIITSLYTNSLGKNLKYGKVGAEAELAFYSRHLGFVNNNRVQGQYFFQILKKYVQLKTGYEIQRENLPLNMTENLSAFMKIKLCQKYLNEPLLRYNEIFFNEDALLATVSDVVEMVVEFRYHDVPTIMETFIQCPIKSGTEPAGYFYVTFVERAEFEREDHYYVFVEERPGVVVPLMRSKYNSGSLFSEIVGSLQSYVWKIFDTALSFGED